MQYCGQCGVQNTIAAVFCRACGAKLLLSSGAASPGAPASAAPKPPITSSTVAAPSTTPPKAAATSAAQPKPVVPPKPAAQLPPPIPPKPPKPKKERKPLSKKTKRIIAISLIGSMGVTLSAIFLVPRTVAVQIEVSSPTGGLFNADCTLTADGQSVMGDKIQALIPGSTPSAGSGASITFESSGASCLGHAVIYAVPFTDYNLYVGTIPAGALSASAIEAGGVSAAVEASVTHDFTGVITVSDKYDSCSGTPTQFDCSWTYTSVDNFSVDVDQPNKTCTGRTDFSGVKPGGEVIIKGRGTHRVSKGKLTAGTYKLASIKTGAISCSLPFTVNAVPFDAAGYDVSVPGHKGVTYSSAELVTRGWDASMEFKN